MIRSILLIMEMILHGESKAIKGYINQCHGMFTKIVLFPARLSWRNINLQKQMTGYGTIKSIISEINQYYTFAADIHAIAVTYNLILKTKLCNNLLLAFSEKYILIFLYLIRI